MGRKKDTTTLKTLQPFKVLTIFFHFKYSQEITVTRQTVKQSFGNFVFQADIFSQFQCWPLVKVVRIRIQKNPFCFLQDLYEAP